MSALRNIRMLASYNAWANDRIFTALSALAMQDADGRTGMASMLRILNHANIIDHVWKAHLEGKEHGFTSRNTDTTPSLGELRLAQTTMDDWYIAYANTLCDALHDEMIRFRFIDGGEGCMRRGDILLHIVNHKTYHRGYVAQMMYDLSLRPPGMDLPVFLRDVWRE